MAASRCHLQLVAFVAPPVKPLEPALKYTPPTREGQRETGSGR